MIFGAFEEDNDVPVEIGELDNAAAGPLLEMNVAMLELGSLELVDVIELGCKTVELWLWLWLQLSLPVQLSVLLPVLLQLSVLLRVLLRGDESEEVVGVDREEAKELLADMDELKLG